ncbi:DUF2280 domain-containing protein [Allopusillimonas ginsengisoli]|nr:DUF2280 domain-containing protein [Allopusillimonas ginsengisoli]
MAALNDAVKRFIVQALACYDTPQQVSEAVKEEFGLEVPRQQVALYDPTKHAGRNLSNRWRALFEATRENFKAQAGEIPIAQRAYRLRKMAQIASKAEQMRNLPLVLQILEQAAKEVGDVYVNRRLDQPKTPALEASVPAAEYTLSPDEDVPDNPIL